ncbi:NAD-dependent epimerase/dehydratase family protein [Micromonospora sp. CNB394]|uniref:polysaccharide biosynthesis C-terminal domain-containing protein n=1 Tax=Micromonospora sp. CNB394 TaxID=1169151 RepID=UPI000476B34A|nr:NAD-dependent epimerase/dehydratase family protein [Micromonospora sp. CNB394]
MRVVLTGAGGFLGWHTRVLLQAIGWPPAVTLPSIELNDPARVASRANGADLLVHLGGVNRGAESDLVQGNAGAASALVRGLRQCPVPPKRVVYANSTQAGNGTPYGDAKAEAAETLAAAAHLGYEFDDVRLPNLYGEHGRPFYNSVVATFCRQLADGGAPEVTGDRELDLVHAQDAAARLIGAPPGHAWDAAMPALRISVSRLAERLSYFAATYRSGEIPALGERHAVRLFNTYRSHCFPQLFPIPLTCRSDARGNLFEAVRVHGGGGQTFASTTRPGISRGDHFHLAKIERFVVLRGSAEIALRRIGHQEVVTFPVGGDAPVVVDMPTMWAHKITNTGSAELLTLFWANEIFDPTSPDTYAEPVFPTATAPA